MVLYIQGGAGYLPSTVGLAMHVPFGGWVKTFRLKKGMNTVVYSSDRSQPFLMMLTPAEN